MDADPKRANKPIAKLLDAANLDLDAARRLLVDPPNVLAANHLQQAAEKILSAVRLHRGLLNTRDHDLVILIDGRPGGEPRPLPAGDEWRERSEIALLETDHEETTSVNDRLVLAEKLTVGREEPRAPVVAPRPATPTGIPIPRSDPTPQSRSGEARRSE
jgi:hypothetical protein